MTQIVDVLERALVYHKLKVIYVPVQKAACTSVKTYLAQLERGEAIAPGKVHAMRATGGQVLSDFSAGRFAELVLFPPMRYTLFSVVRHPFSRFVSAYMDKIKPISGHDQTDFEPNAGDTRSRSILWYVARTRGVPTQDVRDITLDEFLTYLEQSRMPLVNRHWRAQSYLLCKNALPYAHIFKLEDLAKDPETLPDALGVDQPFDLHKNKSDTDRPELTSAIRDRLFRLYALDFNQFGYDPADG